MRDILLNIKLFIDNINEYIGRAVSWLNPLLVLVVCYDVLTRYLFNNSKTWILELEWHLFAVVFLLGAAYTFLHNKHVRVDVFYARFSDRNKALVDFWGGLVFLIPWSFVLMVISVDFAWEAYLQKEGSPNPGGITAWYWVKMVLPLGLFLLLLQGISSVIGAWFLLQDRKTIPIE